MSFFSVVEKPFPNSFKQVLIPWVKPYKCFKKLLRITIKILSETLPSTERIFTIGSKSNFIHSLHVNNCKAAKCDTLNKYIAIKNCD